MELLIKIPASIGKVNEWNSKINVNDKDIDEIIKPAIKRIIDKFKNEKFILEGEMQLTIIAIEDAEIFETDDDGDFNKIN